MKRALLASSAAAAALAVVAALVLARRDAVPVVRVERVDFIRTVTGEGSLRAATAAPLTAPMELDQPVKIAWLAEDGAPVSAGAVVIRFDPTDLEDQLDDGEAAQATARLRLSSAQVKSQATERNLERDAGLAGRELEVARTFQSRDEEIYSRYEITSSAVDTELAKRRKEHAEALRESRGELSEAERAILEIEARKAKLLVDQAHRGLDAMEVRAPHDGILVLERDWRGNPRRVGETVWRGGKIGEVQRPDTLEAEVFVLEADAGGVAPGQAARVTVDGRFREVFEAQVHTLDTLARPRVRNVPVQYFSATLTFAGAGPVGAKPGQRAAATIVVAECAQALVIPLQAVFTVEGRSVVYRRHRFASFKPVNVTLGPTAAGRVVVETGVEVGDVLAAVDPTASTVPATPSPAPPGGRP